MNALAYLVATTGLVGHMRPAPGTWGSLAALPLAWALHYLGGATLLLAASVALFFIGIWATHRLTAGKDDHDPSYIVIDEVVGQWIALLPVSIGAMHSGAGILDLWPGWVSAFLLFRLFDITKPGPVGWADRRKDALGVMLDDVVAGVFAALGVGALAYLAHGVFGV
ncbi:MAG: phosphatidylglycerophosphatase A [Pseudomonadota bacterium]